METYLVGGAVRDQLLGLPVVDRDWVVVGASPQQMLDQGFLPVGKDFPVFLHPETHEEYALARKERKTGSGYGGFDFDVSQSVSLQDDLLRRDLTINAIAQTRSGVLIDPHGGQQDLINKTLRHVSEAFTEDPLRVLRVARFYARLSPLGFTVHSDTGQLIEAMVARGDLAELASERVWLEISKGLSEKSPQRFFAYLNRCGAVRALLPAVDASLRNNDHLSSVESNVEKRITGALEAGLSYSLSAEENWAVICHAVGDPARAKNLQLVPPSRLENKALEACAASVSASRAASRLALAVNVLLPTVLQASTLKPEYTLRVLELCDAFRQSSILDSVTRVASSLAATDLTASVSVAQSGVFLRACYEACAAIKADEFVASGLKGEAIAKAIRTARKIAIANIQ